MSKLGVKLSHQVIKDINVKTVVNTRDLGAMYQLTVTDRDGRVTQQWPWRRSHSFVQQFMQLWYVQAAGLSLNFALPIRDTSNTLRNVRNDGGGVNHQQMLECNGAAADVTQGIVIGSAAVVPAIADFVMAGLIAHATMNYGAVTTGAPANDATTSQFTLTRNFANVSGVGQTVTELGLIANGYDGAARRFLIIHDSLGAGILVPNGQTLTVNYRIQAAVPGITAD